ncbi:MAG: ABC transporter permease subunit [Chloroflexi bacterium]|nr:ABC transporter permease subunit [Chloroflexota bacterium]
MRNVLAIAGKELNSYFTSPMAYVITAVFLAMSGLFFAQDLNISQIARLQGFLGASSFLLLLLSPILTMRLLAEEQKLGTLELLLTAPVRDHEVVLGKYLAALGILLGMLALTLYYPLLLILFAQPDYGPMLSGYFGLLLLGAAFLSVGLFASSLSSNQIVAAVLGIGILILLWVMGTAGNLAPNLPLVKTVLEYLAISSHFSDMLRGVIDTKDVVYYLSVIAVALFFSTRSLETRRWR